MSNTFRTEADVMVTTAGQVDNTNNEVQSELSRLRGVVDGLRGAWSGQAQTSFDELMQRWDTNAKDLSDALTSIGENIRANARSFENVEASNAQSLNHVGGGLVL